MKDQVGAKWLTSRRKPLLCFDEEEGR